MENYTFAKKKFLVTNPKQYSNSYLNSFGDFKSFPDNLSAEDGVCVGSN